MKRTVQAIGMLVVFLSAGCGGGGGGGGGAIDTAAPTISRVAVTPSIIAPGVTAVRVEADVTDDRSGVDVVSVEVMYPDGSGETKALTPTTSSTYAVQFTPVWGGGQPGTVRFTVSARDRVGNSGSASPREVRGAAPPPPVPSF